MTRPNLESVPDFYRGYVEIVQDMDVLDALRHAGRRAQQIVPYVPEEKGAFRYAEGKWTIKEVICHLQDAERVFAYRALRFARNDQTPLAAFDENLYATQANAHARSVQELAREMKRLRDSTIDLFASFTPDMLSREGTASGKKISVLTIGYIIAGHELHHYRILNERYLNT
jgi:hypothetical protein